MTTTSTANPSELVIGSCLFGNPGYLKASNFQESNRLSKADRSMSQTSQNHYESSTTLSSRPISPESKNSNYNVAGHDTNNPTDLASDISVEGALSPYRDRCVRNQAHRIFKGKTGSKQEIHGITHIDMSNRKNDDLHINNAAAERDFVACETNEATSYQAKAAQLDQHVPPEIRIAKEIADNSEIDNEASSAVCHEECVRLLAPGDTKIEQARLLTLLRSINPTTVVDQLCKAVTYFGGIPGATPPEDGIFPKSVITKETGALFIGWVAEIFPDLSFQASRISKGIPFNSEGKKNDPIIENFENAARGDTLSNELSNPRNDHESGDAFSGYPWALSLNESIITGNIKRLEHRLTSPSVKQQPEETSSTTTRKRKRGRPKGSRNKKFLGLQGSENPVKAASNFESQESFFFASETSSSRPEFAANRSNYDVYEKNKSAQVDTEHGQKSNSEGSYWIDSQKNNRRSKPNQTFPTDVKFRSEDSVIFEPFKNNGSDILNTEKSSEQGSKEIFSDIKAQDISQGGNLQTPIAPTALKQFQTMAPLCSIKNGNSNFRMVDSSFVSNSGNPQASLHTSKSENSIKAKVQIKLLSITDKKNLSVSSTENTRAANPKYPNPSESVARSSSIIEDKDTIPLISQTARSENKTKPSQDDTSESLPSHSELKTSNERFSNLQQFYESSDISTSMPQQQSLQNSNCFSPSNKQDMPRTPQQKMTKNSQNYFQHDEMKLTPGSLKRLIPTSFYNQRTQKLMPNLSYPQLSAQVNGVHQESPQITHGKYQNSPSLSQPKSKLSSSESNYETLSPPIVSHSSHSYSQNENNYRTSASETMKPSMSFSSPENEHRNSNTDSVVQRMQYFSNYRPQNKIQSTQQANGLFNETSFIDLPTLDSLGHTNNSNNSNLNSSNCGYGQNPGIINSTSRTMTGNNNFYDDVALNTYDANTNHLLRAVVPQNIYNSSSTLYTNPSPRSNNTYDASAANNVTERMMHGPERYR